MSRIVVCGGSMIGLTTAMMLASDGHQVTVLEADPNGVPTAGPGAWEAWRRRGVAQFYQPHSLLTRFRLVCDQELPGLNRRLQAVGCVTIDYLQNMPRSITDRSPRPGDENIWCVTGRRPVVESVVAAAAVEHRGVEVRRGMRAADLCTGADVVPGVPHINGVRTADGAEFPADLVIDAMGQRTPSAGWLATAGAAQPAVEEQDRGFVYYTRYYTGPNRPQRRGPPLQPMGSVSVLTLDSDNDTWSVTLFALTGDAPLKNLRNPDAFTRVVSACPRVAHWLDGTPITDVLAMAGILDRYRRFVVDGRPVVTGLAAVGDAWACTNPSAGRGLSVGILHAQTLRQVVRDHLDDPATFAVEWDARTERDVAPFVRNQIAVDKARIAEMDAIRHGRPAPQADSQMAKLIIAAGADPDAFRALLEIFLCTALPQEVFARPGMTDRIEQVCAEAPPRRAAPLDRAKLLALLAT
jgi:2-polyprenyl-6-methoxyphenol hydroxylase-like FAD-dependent oxidoreductase